MTQERILFVDDEKHLRIAGTQALDLAGFHAESFASGAAALKEITPEFKGVLITDIRMPEMDGVELLRKTLEIDAQIPVVLVTGHGDVGLAVECIKAGAYDFIEKPWKTERLISSVRRAAERRRLVLENRALRNEMQNSEIFKTKLYGRSASIEKVRKAIAAIAETDANVVVCGATGTGKEVAARLIHQQSARAAGQFVHINCAALPEAHFESELFGHEIGAFPGAMRARYGKIEHARGGVLCLDEVDLLPLPLQAKLLDVLHSKAITRLGSNDKVEVNFRVIALSKSNLEEAVAEGRFRSDLMFRLNVVSLQLPGLDERREDIPGLFTLLSSEIAKQNDLTVPQATVEMLNALSARDWPGNVRELRNEAERFVLGFSDVSQVEPKAKGSLGDQVNAYERALISAAILANKGGIKATCESLAVSRRALYDKMQKYGLSRSDFLEHE